MLECKKNMRYKLATNQTRRVLELLKRFNDGKMVCIDNLIHEAQCEKQGNLWFNDNQNRAMSQKSIRRDLDVIREFFPDSFSLIKGKKGCYKAVTKNLFDNFLNKETLSLLVQTFNIAQRSNLFKNFDIDKHDKSIINAQIKKSQKCYLFIQKPYENLNDKLIFLDKIENAINFQKYIEVEYEIDKKTVKYTIKPYKIVFMNENFYLVGENTNSEFLFIILRLTQIQSINITKNQFHVNFDIIDFIQNLQTPFPKYSLNYKQNLIEVVLQVSKEKAKYFKLKKHLPSQEVIENKDGTLNLYFKVTQEKELENLIKKWLPHIKVIKPISLKNDIQSKIKKWLD